MASEFEKHIEDGTPEFLRQAVEELQMVDAEEKFVDVEPDMFQIIAPLTDASNA